jgi:hypothetical protein
MAFGFFVRTGAFAQVWTDTSENKIDAAKNILKKDLLFFIGY